MEGVRSFFLNPKHRRLHVTIVATALVVHGLLHYLTYIPAVQPVVGNLPYFRLHVLHEAEFLLIIVYAAITLRWKGAAGALAFTAFTSVPFILTPYIFGREPRPDELRDQAIQVGFILLMGGLMIYFIENASRERDQVSAHAKRLSALAEVSRTASASLDPHVAVGSTLPIVRNTLGGQAVLAYAYVPLTSSLM